MLKGYQILLTFVIILIVLHGCKMYSERYLTASIVTQHQGTGGVVKSRLLSHFKGEQDESGRWSVEPIDDGIFDERDVVFMANHYKTDEGKQLVSNFLENPESFPTHTALRRAKTQDFSEFDNSISAAEERVTAANAEVERIRAEINAATNEADAKGQTSNQLQSRIDELLAELESANADALAADAELDEQIAQSDELSSSNLANWLNVAESEYVRPTVDTGTTNVNFCSPWRGGYPCPRAGRELTCGEYVSCLYKLRSESGKDHSHCGDSPYYKKCILNQNTLV